MAVKLIFSDGKPANSDWRMKLQGQSWNIQLPKACHSPEPICHDYSNMGYDGCFNCPHHKEPA